MNKINKLHFKKLSIFSRAKTLQLRYQVHLKQTGNRVHTVEDSERKSNIYYSCPHCEFVEFGLQGMIKLGTGTEGWHDP